MLMKAPVMFCFGTKTKLFIFGIVLGSVLCLVRNSCCGIRRKEAPNAPDTIHGYARGRQPEHNGSREQPPVGVNRDCPSWREAGKAGQCVARQNESPASFWVRLPVFARGENDCITFPFLSATICEKAEKGASFNQTSNCFYWFNLLADWKKTQLVLRKHFKSIKRYFKSMPVYVRESFKLESKKSEI